jgi:lysophospholipase L1-like esterase
MWNEEVYASQTSRVLIKELASRNGFYSLDLTDTYTKYPDTKIKIKDGTDRDHPNEFGHELVASAIEEYLKGQKFVLDNN